jgi:hypothetical protein
MAKTTQDRWNPDFINRSPLFFPLQHQATLLSRNPEHWPSLEDYHQLLAEQPVPIHTSGDAQIQFVPQAGKPQRWEDDYEPRIYLTGEVQTRLHNWHDFFQVLVWTTFPKTKTALNTSHYHAIHQRKQSNPGSKQRTPLENALTQFDECGAIVVASQNNLLQLIREFRWKDLFWQHRTALAHQLQCFVFGHAVYEKALNPYVGLTAHAILMNVENEFFQWPLAQQINFLDDIAAQAFANARYPSPKHFQPFPLLGMPGWDHNEIESYYDNSDYFRPGRRERQYE